MSPPSVTTTATTSILDNKSVLITGGTGSFGRAFVEREYSWQTIVNRWLDELGVETPAPAVSVAQPAYICKESV